MCHHSLILDDKLAGLSSLAGPVPMLMLQTGESEVARFKGYLKLDWAVRLPGSSVTTIPEDARARAISPMMPWT